MRFAAVPAAAAAAAAAAEKAHKHKRFFPVTARVPAGGGGLPTGWPGVKRYVLCAEPKEHKHFRPVARLEGSVTEVTEKLFMCQMFMCLFFGPYCCCCCCSGRHLLRN